jgi:hypothetical protein
MQCDLPRVPLRIEANIMGGRKVKRKRLLACALLVIAATVIAGFVPTSMERSVMAADGDKLLTVMNPAIAGKVAERFPLAPRLSTLEGKTIYFVDIQWGGPEAAYSVYEEMQAWFAKNMPSVKTVLRRTTDNMFADDPGMRKEMIEKHADAAIVGIAG